MIATTAKLVELLEAASPRPWAFDVRVVVIMDSRGDEIEEPADLKLAALAPDLARLVVTLAEEGSALVQELDGHPEGLCMCDFCKALAAVEELRL